MLSFLKPKTVASVTAGLDKMVDDLGEVIALNEQRIHANMSAINQLQDEINVARVEQDKAARVADKIGSLLS